MHLGGLNKFRGHGVQQVLVIVAVAKHFSGFARDEFEHRIIFKAAITKQGAKN